MTASPLQVARHLTKIVVASALFTMAGLASAAYPERPITLVVPFAPGGSSDNVARTIGPLLGEKLGQPIVIDNVGGAGGMLGTRRQSVPNPMATRSLLALVRNPDPQADQPQSDERRHQGPDACSVSGHWPHGAGRQDQSAGERCSRASSAGQVEARRAELWFGW